MANSQNVSFEGNNKKRFEIVNFVGGNTLEKHMPKISVIVPVYNVKTYLDKCVDSIVTQTYNNLEIILIDDGSTDNSSQICDAWAERDSRIKVIHQKNSGVAAARNKGLQIATGDYIGFVDSDDWIVDTMYRNMMEGIWQTGADAAFTGYKRVLESGKQIGHQYKMSGLCSRDEAILSVIEGGYFVTIWNKLFSRDICIKNEKIIRFEPFLCGEDEHWLIRVLLNTNKVYLINQTAYFWQIRSKSITYDRYLFDRRLDVFRVKQANCKLLQNVNVVVYQAAVVDQYINMYTTLVDAYIHKNREACELMKEHLKDYKKVYLTSNESFLSKCKKLLVEFMIRLHLPRAIVRAIDHVSG